MAPFHERNQQLPIKKVICRIDMRDKIGMEMEEHTGIDQVGLLSERIDKSWPSLAKDAVFLIESEYLYLYGVDDLADRLEVTKHHLIRVFSAASGISPGKYLTEVRIAQAKKMLRIGDDTPLEIIAGACGYSCANYFSKAFKKQTGLTPSEYAKAFRRDSKNTDTALLPEELYL